MVELGSQQHRQPPGDSIDRSPGDQRPGAHGTSKPGAIEAVRQPGVGAGGADGLKAAHPQSPRDRLGEALVRRDHDPLHRYAGAPLEGGAAAQCLGDDGQGLGAGERPPKLRPVVVVPVHAQREVSSPRAKDGRGARVREARVEWHVGHRKVVAVLAGVAQQLGVVEVPVARAPQIRVVDHEGRAQWRRWRARAGGQLSQEVGEGQQRQAAPGAQAFAQGLARLKLRRGAGDALV